MVNHESGGLTMRDIDVFHELTRRLGEAMTDEAAAEAHQALRDWHWQMGEAHATLADDHAERAWRGSLPDNVVAMRRA